MSRKHGGQRPGAGRPKQPTVRDVALALSKPSGKPSVGSTPRGRVEPTLYVSAAYRPSKASARRSAIPAAAIRARGPEKTIQYRKRSNLPPAEADLRDWLAKKGCRSLSSIEAQFADILDAQAANNKTTSNRKALQKRVSPDDDNLLDFKLGDNTGFDSILYASPTRKVLGREPGASIGDFLVEDFYGGGKMPGELRGIKVVR